MKALTLDRLAHIHLKSGGHNRRSETSVCAMEAAAWLAGEPHSDSPSCTCPAIAAFIRSWNDSLPTDEDRDRLLKPLLPDLLNTRSTPEVQQRRADLALEWLICEYAPASLSLAGLTEAAAALRNNPTHAAIAAAKAEAEKAGSAAWSAARSAAWSAAWSAARSAAWSAARSAARSAAESAARSAARSAAESAARSAAWSAAESAAESALAPMVAELQDSAVKLIRRMIAGEKPTRLGNIITTVAA